MLFMPAHEADEKLQAVLTYYDAVVNVTAEGDSVVSDDTLEGLGTEGSSSSLLESLFGSLLRIANPVPAPPTPSSPPSQTYGAIPPSIPTTSTSKSTSSFLDEAGAVVILIDEEAEQAVAAAAKLRTRLQNSDGTPEYDETEDTEVGLESTTFKLTDFAPHPGYFLAGAIAGGVSRTATAPLDRLKVYLLVNTNDRGETAVAALKRFNPLIALKNGARPFGDAMRDVYRSGGLRGFFAGEWKIVLLRNAASVDLTRCQVMV